jgi:O-antigen/teichoic acid export membrane protein
MTTLTKVRSRVPTTAVGALSAQIVLALGGFVVQAAAARELGAAEAGGAIVMATALSTGLVGDSLTVLDRNDPAIRRALFVLAAALVLAMTSIGIVVTTRSVPIPTAGLFGLALACYVIADLLRRLIMTGLRFWSLVLADLLGLIAMVTFIGAGMFLTDTLPMAYFLAALVVSQVTASLVVLIRLPRGERGLPRTKGWGNLRAVIGYGSWRGLQQFVRPTMINCARWLVLVAGGAAAVGELEAGRIFVAPAMLLIQGLGSYLFSNYAHNHDAEVSTLLARADRVALITVIGSSVVAMAAWPLLPVLGDVITGGRFALDIFAVIGWACYAASCATVLPYGSLAAVRGRQRAVFGIRVLDSVLSLGLAALLVVGIGIDTAWTPWLLSVGSFIGGILCRQWLVRSHERAVAT